MLNVQTIQRLVAKRQIGSTPEKRGAKNMEQVSIHGKMSVAQIKATLTAATLDAVHEGKFNNEYAPARAWSRRGDQTDQDDEGIREGVRPFETGRPPGR